MTPDDTLAALRTSLVLIANECVQPTDQHTIPRIQSLAHDALAGVRVAPSPDAPGLREADEAVDEAQKALVAAIEKRTWQAAAGPIVPGGAEVNEAIRNFRAAIERAAIPPRDALDVERLARALLAALPCEDPEEDCDADGRADHRWCDYCIARAVTATHVAAIAREYAALDRETPA